MKTINSFSKFMVTAVLTAGLTGFGVSRPSTTNPYAPAISNDYIVQKNDRGDKKDKGNKRDSPAEKSGGSIKGRGTDIKTADPRDPKDYPKIG